MTTGPLAQRETPAAVQEIIALVFPAVMTLRYSEWTEGAGNEVSEGSVLLLILQTSTELFVASPPCLNKAFFQLSYSPGFS